MRWYRLALLLAVTGCGGAAACPDLVGCSSQLTVRLPAGTAAAEACVAGVCSTTVVRSELLVPLSRGAEGETAAVTVTIAGSPAYTGDVPLTRTRPSGPRCPPVCVNGTAVVDTAAGRVVPAPA
jgi:hypothetical protein